MMRLQQSDLEELAVLDSLHKPNLQGIWPGYFYDRDMALKSKAATDFEKIHGQRGVNTATVGNYRKWTDQRVKQLRNFSGPVFLVQGRQDPIGESTIYEIKELLPQTQISMIEKCGHLPWLEKEDRQVIFYELLEKALQ